MKSFSFGLDTMESDYKKVKYIIQHSHFFTEVNRSTVNSASAWASAKWGKNMDYRIILGHLGIKIVED